MANPDIKERIIGIDEFNKCLKFLEDAAAKNAEALDYNCPDEIVEWKYTKETLADLLTNLENLKQRIS